MENPEEILHSLEEFSKMKPKDIPRELEEYLCFVAKTGDPVYQWSAIKSLFREKLINVITEFYESCPSVEIPPCPNVEIFNYDLMKNFILEKLDTFASAPFTVQRICELLTTPRKEYNRIDKYMRALEKNILVVSTMEPGNRRSTENGESIMNGIESEHVPEPGNEINVEEMDESPSWPQNVVQSVHIPLENKIETNIIEEDVQQNNITSSPFSSLKITHSETTLTEDSGISCTVVDEQFVSIVPVTTSTQPTAEGFESSKGESVTITAVSVSLTSVQTNTNVSEVIPTIDSVLKDCGDHNVTSQEKPLEDEVSDVTKQINQEPEILITEVLPFPTENQEEECPSTTDPLIKQDEDTQSNSESAGIENISPETSTSAPENIDLDITVVPTKDTTTIIDSEDAKEAKQEELLLKSEEIAAETVVESPEDICLNKSELSEALDLLVQDSTLYCKPVAEEISAKVSEENIDEQEQQIDDHSDTKCKDAIVEDVKKRLEISEDSIATQRLSGETEVSTSCAAEVPTKSEETLPEKDLDVCKTEESLLPESPKAIEEEVNQVSLDIKEEEKVQNEESLEKSMGDSKDTSTPMEVDSVVDSTEKSTDQTIIGEVSEAPEKLVVVNSAVDDLGQSTTL